MVNLESETVQARQRNSSAEQALAAVPQRIEEFCSERVRRVQLVVPSEMKHYLAHGVGSCTWFVHQ